MIHIGKEIQHRLYKEGKSVIWLAQQLSCTRSNIYKIFEKQSIDTDLLLRISNILHHDFFTLYQKEIQ